MPLALHVSCTKWHSQVHTTVGSEEDSSSLCTNSIWLERLSIHSFVFLIAHLLLCFVLLGTTPWHPNTRSSTTTEKRFKRSRLFLRIQWQGHIVLVEWAVFVRQRVLTACSFYFNPFCHENSLASLGWHNNALWHDSVAMERMWCHTGNLTKKNLIQSHRLMHPRNKE